MREAEVATCPGRRMIIAPMKPTTVARPAPAAHHLVQQDTAKIVANSGDVKDSAVASASGISASALNHISIDRKPRNERPR